jgi:broad specificity phosphatase PhoE/glycosyltransferase involved in cell wall biosynthesis
MPLHAFEACTGEYILQVDSDLLVGRRDVTHDYLGEMMAELEVRPSAVCASLNIPRQEPLPFTTDEDGCPWRVEVRGCLLHKARLLAARPLTNHVEDGLPALSWHRSLDASIQAERLESLRGGGNHTYFIHPPNDLKQSVGDWMLILDLVEKGQLPEEQVGHVDLVGGPLLWVPDERSEPLVFVITGRNVPPGRALRCLTSLAAQSRTDWGAVIVDDGSSEWSREHLRLSVAPLKDRVTLLQPRERRGQLANTALAIRHVCTDPDSVIVTLDLDDALLGPGVADRILAEHRRGTDVTVGTMLRTDKHAEYPVTFDNPRQSRGGNVWQHLRSFRKYLFDAIPDHDLRIDGSYVDIAVDWAFMLPIVELAEHPVWIREPLYLYEPSGLGKGPSREERERQIAAVVSRPPRTRSGRDSKSLLLTPEDLVREGWRTDSGILFIRHGERPSFKGLNADERDAMRLTENGRAAARVLGQHLGSDTGIASSPVPRARETAECLAEGAGGAPAPIRVMEQLVDFRVTDPETYESFKRRLGWAGLMMAWTDGSLPSGVLIPCDQVACAAVRGVLGHSGCQRSIAVTHDFLIIALLATLYGVRQTAIPYLGGLFLSEAQADLLVNKETHP